jgi:hypothetical protein
MCLGIPQGRGLAGTDFTGDHRDAADANNVIKTIGHTGQFIGFKDFIGVEI